MTCSASPVRRARMSVLLVVVAFALFAGTPAASAARSTPTLVAATGQDVVVFDIDGTLTTDEGSSSVQPSAAAAVNAYVQKGYDVVYVTARWRLLQESSTRSWLASNGFPARTLVMSPTILFSDSSKVRFKTSAMTQLEQGTPEIVGAYGDSSSDFTAYANVAVPRDRVFALKRRSAFTCQSGTYAACLTSGYTTHLPFINALPPGR
jgi:phosphatidate phosphatase PAH1